MKDMPDSYRHHVTAVMLLAVAIGAAAITDRIAHSDAPEPVQGANAAAVSITAEAARAGVCTYVWSGRPYSAVLAADPDCAAIFRATALADCPADPTVDNCAACTVDGSLCGGVTNHEES